MSFPIAESNRQNLWVDGNGLGGANGLAQLAGNATLVAGGVSPQGVLSAESWTQIAPLVGVVNGHLGLETDLQGQTQSANDFREKENLGSSVKDSLPRSLKRRKEQIVENFWSMISSRWSRWNGAMKRATTIAFPKDCQ